MTPLSSLPPKYSEVLESVKSRIRASQIRATLAANRELIELYWDLGRTLAQRQDDGWGSAVVERLSRDLRSAFPDSRGFSPRNLWRMARFFRAWSTVGEDLPQVVAELPWGQNSVLIEKLGTVDDRRWYAVEARRHGWSRAMLTMQIESGLHLRQGRAISNFSDQLPEPASTVAQQMLKDPYLFGFLGLEDDAQERDIERALLLHVRDFLLELGVGFAFVGNQYRLEVGSREFFVDLLFYHLSLHCYVVVELKAVGFEPEHAGKLNFYLAAVDEQVRDPERDGPTIGLLLCKTKDQLVVEYALRYTTTPIGYRRRWTAQGRACRSLRSQSERRAAPVCPRLRRVATTVPRPVRTAERVCTRQCSESPPPAGEPFSGNAADRSCVVGSRGRSVRVPQSHSRATSPHP